MSARTHLPSGLVTFLFTDIEGSTRLAQHLGSGYRQVLHEHRRILRETLCTDGVELFTEGDSFFFAFADAGAAVTGCVTAQRALAGWAGTPDRPRVRMGLHTGWATPQGGEYASAEVHRAARIAQAAHGGQILCSLATARLADRLPEGVWLLDLGLYRLRGFDGREQLFQVVAPGLEYGFPRPRAVAAPHNLPAATTSFVGRRRERDRLAELVAAHRLVTVTGPGGAGKTRLAVEVADGLVEAYRDGVWFLDVATVTDPGLVAVALAAILGLRPEPGRPILDTLAEYLGPRRSLLLLDTCDAHVGAVAELLARLLAEAPEVRVLATSREPVGLPGELVWRIPALSLDPAPDGGPAEAVALLVERTTAARGGQAPHSAELPHLTRIARRLGGLPLALELAAARLRVLGAAQLADRFDVELAGSPGDLLGTLDAGRGRGGGRHATLEDTVEWSYRTLDDDAARLLRWLSVYATPVDLATAEWLVGRDPLPALTTLVDKSLVHAEPAVTGATYRMLDPIRSYAARALAAVGEERAARERHVAWSLHALERAQLGPDGRPGTLSLHALDGLADEVRAALHWCVTGGAVRPALRLIRGLEQWWRERGLAREARLWLFRFYGRIAETGEEIPPAELAVAYYVHSLHAGADGEYAEQLRFSQRAEAAAHRAGDDGLLARVLSGRGPSLLDLGRDAEAERACREVIAWATQRDVVPDALLAILCLAKLLWRRRAFDEAAELLGSARQAEAARPDVRGRRSVDLLLGMVALARGDLVAAHDHVTVALRSQMEHGYHSRACESLNAMAVRCALGADPVTAARLFGASDANRAQLRRRPGHFAAYWSEQQNAVRAALGDERFDAAYAAGGQLSLAEAAAVALGVEHPDLSSAQPGAHLLDRVTLPEARPLLDAGHGTA